MYILTTASIRIRKLLPPRNKVRKLFFKLKSQCRLLDHSVITVREKCAIPIHRGMFINVN